MPAVANRAQGPNDGCGPELRDQDGGAARVADEKVGGAALSPPTAIAVLARSQLGNEHGRPLPCSAKTVLHLKPAQAGQPPGPSVNDDTNFIRISFRKGGRDEVCACGARGGSCLHVIVVFCLLAQFSRVLEDQLRQKEWEKLKSLPQARPPAPGGPSRMRAGIMGIERDIQQKQSRANAQVSEAFKDLDALIGKVAIEPGSDGLNGCPR